MICQELETPLVEKGVSQPSNTFSGGNLIPPTPNQNYIMRGSVAKRALDIYHLILAPTHACNLRCKHCYLPNHDTDLLPREVALRLVDEWSGIVLAERGVFRGIFHVKGGEPFVVPYIGDIMERLAELKSLRLMLTTNGTFAKPEIVERLRMCNDALTGHVTVVVSLDGASAPTHEQLRGVGQFKTTMLFLETLQTFGIQTFLNCVLHEGNLHEVQDYIDLAKHLNISQINFLPLVPKGYGKGLRCHQMPHLQVHKVLQQAFDKGNTETRRLLAGSLPDILDRESKGDLCAATECVAAYRGLLYIKPDGSTNTCPNLEEPHYSIANVHQVSLQAIMDKLNSLYGRLHADGKNDKYICTGERKRYEIQNDQLNLSSLSNLQETMDNDTNSKATFSSKEIAFCVSRNW